MQMGRRPLGGALDRAYRARARERAARSMGTPARDDRGQWQGHHTDDEAELNGASGAGGGYVGLYGGVVAGIIGVVTGDRALFISCLLIIAVAGFLFGALSGGASGRNMKASLGDSFLYGSLFSFLAVIIAAIVGFMLMVPVMMVLIATEVGRYGPSG